LKNKFKENIMPSAQALLGFINSAVIGAKEIDPCTLSWLTQLKDIIDEELPELVDMRVNTVYLFEDKKGRRNRAVMTKENSKTFVLYEVNGSTRPGCRWMLDHRWCTSGNIVRDTSQSYTMSDGVKIK
jgi:hypothetical protein